MVGPISYCDLSPWPIGCRIQIRYEIAPRHENNYIAVAIEYVAKIKKALWRGLTACFSPMTFALGN